MPTLNGHQIFGGTTNNGSITSPQFSTSGGSGTIVIISQSLTISTVQSVSDNLGNSYQRVNFSGSVGTLLNANYLFEVWAANSNQSIFSGNANLTVTVNYQTTSQTPNASVIVECLYITPIIFFDSIGEDSNAINYNGSPQVLPSGQPFSTSLQTTTANPNELVINWTFLVVGLSSSGLAFTTLTPSSSSPSVNNIDSLFQSLPSQHYQGVIVNSYNVSSPSQTNFSQTLNIPYCNYAQWWTTSIGFYESGIFTVLSPVVTLLPNPFANIGGVPTAFTTASTPIQGLKVIQLPL
jgi:hypothetical protein